MIAADFRALIEGAGLTQLSAARMLRCDVRTVRRYLAGRPIPLAVEIALTCLIQHTPRSVEEAINTVSAIGNKYGGSGHLLDAAKVLAAEVRRLRHFEPLIGGVPINEYVLQQRAEELEERLAETQSKLTDGPK